MINPTGTEGIAQVDQVGKAGGKGRRRDEDFGSGQGLVILAIRVHRKNQWVLVRDQLMAYGRRSRRTMGLLPDILIERRRNRTYVGRKIPKS